MKGILNQLDMTQKEFREICVLSGTDYTNWGGDDMYIYQYVKNTLNQEILCDNIVAGTDQEVIRKLRNIVEDQRIDLNVLSSYDLCLEEINTYTV
jgi:hypothetical protein